MTTVAYKNGVIAYDSRTTVGSLIIDDAANKKRTRDSTVFVFCGRPDQYDDFIDAYFSESKEINKRNECSAIASESGKVFVCGIDENGYIFKTEINDIYDIYAIGSGCDFAWTAMDMGATAKEAVKIAMKRDVYTGGEVRSLLVSI